MAEHGRETLIRHILALEPDLLRARFCEQPPPLLHMDITVPQLKTLVVLFLAPATEAAPGVRVSDLARALAVTPATASSLVDRLVERGLVERREDPQDRRQRHCRLSDSGQQLAASLFEVARSQTQALLDVLSEPELEVVLRGMEIMIQAGDRLRGAEAPQTVVTDSAAAAERGPAVASHGLLIELAREPTP